MIRRIFAPPTFLLAAFMFVLGALLTGAPALLAQGTPEAAGTPGAEPGYPVHIHSGTCADLGDVVHPLNDLTPIGDGMAANATPEAAMGMGGTPVADEGPIVAESTTIIDVTLDELMEGEYAINVHESAENMGNFIACGDVAVDETGDRTVIVPLQELNDSSFSGRATVTDNDDGTTTVTITMSTTNLAATPAASPSN